MLKTLSLLCIGFSLAAIPCAANAGDIEQIVVEQSALPAGFEHEPELELTAGVNTLPTRCLFDGEEEVTCVPVASGDDSDETDLATLSGERARCWVTLEYCTPSPYCTCTPGCSAAKCQSSCDSLYNETC